MKTLASVIVAVSTAALAFPQDAPPLTEEMEMSVELASPKAEDERDIAPPLKASEAGSLFNQPVNYEGALVELRRQIREGRAKSFAASPSALNREQKLRLENVSYYPRSERAQGFILLSISF